MATCLTSIKARIFTDNTDNFVELRTLIGINGPIEPLLRYQMLFQRQSFSWHDILCRAVWLLCKYANANAGVFASSRDLFESFSVRLRSGTIGPDGLDGSGLYWKPKAVSHANHLISALTNFSGWMAKTYDVPPINPLRDATQHEQVIAAAAWESRNNASFLGHTESKEKAYAELRKTPWVPREPTPKVVGEKKPRFPENSFLPLIFEGFLKVKNEADPFLRLDLRCVLITILMHGGGLRVSECFHLYVGDVQIDPLDRTKALVRIGDPERGMVEFFDTDGKKKECSRAEYLASCGLKPRNKVLGRRHAGWKNPTLDGKYYLQVFWSDAVYGQLFLRAWRLYLRQLAQTPQNHPWAFVNFGKNQGEPYTIGRFTKAHKRAVTRIGLAPGKTEGTTVHGHRHAYLYRLADAKLDPVMIKRVAHHHSINSQLVYTEADSDKVKEVISESYKRLENSPINWKNTSIKYQPILKSLENK